MKVYYFQAGDTITIPIDCQIVFYVDGKVVYPEFTTLETFRRIEVEG